ncbi:histidine phosphatase family protein [Paenibacillus sp. S150]|uniref:histidine phosphatase family protein n=1 Tax=Paenibacillus sp. S150 TaxID=2749826 RepID=UPI001C591D39|nr:histidine phosphatase family protein [Paenibacillus sp. S150]MBW4084928.1 histidine phosphatase family protein [Paenibacillus sp. S150]
MAATTVYITRHGQTEWNVQNRMQGHLDSPLTPLGEQQAGWLNRGLYKEPLDIIYTSSSPRALRTAEIVRGGRSIPLTACDEFKEIGMGLWEGQNSGEIEARDPEQHHHFWQDPEKFSVEGGETFAGVQKRALDKLLEIVAAHDGQSILIVTHTVVIKVLMAHFEERAMNKLWELPYIYPACLCKLEFTAGRAKILLHGDTGHYEAGEDGMKS